jgi:hypothetical protein
MRVKRLRAFPKVIGRNVMNHVQMTFGVDAGLHADFAEALRVDGRLAGDVLLDFVRTYVGQALERKKKAASRPLSKAERRRRANAVDFAQTAVTLEGFQRSNEAQANAQRFICGEIGLKEFLVSGCREMEERVGAFLQGARWSG